MVSAKVLTLTVALLSLLFILVHILKLLLLQSIGYQHKHLMFFFILLQKLYTVCDVAMNIIMSKSTTYSLESPKDPVLPARFFTQPDKVVNFGSVCISGNTICFQY